MSSVVVAACFSHGMQQRHTAERQRRNLRSRSNATLHLKSVIRIAFLQAAQVVSRMETQGNSREVEKPCVKGTFGRARASPTVLTPRGLLVPRIPYVELTTNPHSIDDEPVEVTRPVRHTAESLTRPEIYLGLQEWRPKEHPFCSSSGHRASGGELTTAHRKYRATYESRLSKEYGCNDSFSFAERTWALKPALPL